jgi:hypothetical protein
LHQHPRIFVNVFASNNNSESIADPRSWESASCTHVQRKTSPRSRRQVMSSFPVLKILKFGVLPPNFFLMQFSLRFIPTVLSIFLEDTSTWNRPIGSRDAPLNTVPPANPQAMRSPVLARISIYLIDKPWFWSAVVVWWCWIILVRRRLLRL